MLIKVYGVLGVFGLCSCCAEPFILLGVAEHHFTYMVEQGDAFCSVFGAALNISWHNSHSHFGLREETFVVLLICL